MINELHKEAILKGAFGLSRDGHKCRYIGKNESSDFPYQFVYYQLDEVIQDVANLSEQFTYLKDSEGDLDVVDLWENRIEPFNLEKALEGEPVLLRNGKKAHLKFIMPKEYKGLFPVKGYIIDDTDPEGAYTLSWGLNGKSVREGYDHRLDIIGMYREPGLKPNTVTLMLPCPLKEPRDEMWFLHMEGPVRSTYNKKVSIEGFNKIPYFGSKEDAQAWFDAMQNSRK